MSEQQVNGLVIHVSSLNDRSTEVVMRELIRIGACEDCDVKIRLPQGATSTGPVIELARKNGIYRIASVDPTYHELRALLVSPSADFSPARRERNVHPSH